MPRKGKEPAGLRRWRLAHKKKRRYHKVIKVAKRRYYGRRKKGGRRGSKALPAVQTAMLALPVVTAFKNNNYNITNGTVDSVYSLTGYSLTEKKWVEPNKAIGLGVALFVMSTVGSKIANRVGANKLLKKVSGGYIKLM